MKISGISLGIHDQHITSESPGKRFHPRDSTRGCALRVQYVESLLMQGFGGLPHGVCFPVTLIRIGVDEGDGFPGEKQRTHGDICAADFGAEYPSCKGITTPVLAPGEIIRQGNRAFAVFFRRGNTLIVRKLKPDLSRHRATDRKRVNRIADVLIGQPGFNNEIFYLFSQLSGSLITQGGVGGSVLPIQPEQQLPSARRQGDRRGPGRIMH